MNDFLGLGLIIKEQRERIAYLEFENKLLFDHLKGDEDDLKAFKRALEKALSATAETKPDREASLYGGHAALWRSNYGPTGGT